MFTDNRFIPIQLTKEHRDNQYHILYYHFIKLAFGDPLKKAIQSIFSFEDEQLWGNRKEIIDEFWNVSPRDVMQFVGTECFRKTFGEKYNHIGNKIWIMVMKKNIDKLLASGVRKIIISDLRFQNEEQFIRKLGGIVIRVNRNIPYDHDDHISENMIDKLRVDHIVQNDNIHQLYEDIDRIMKTY